MAAKKKSSKKAPAKYYALRDLKITEQHTVSVTHVIPDKVVAEWGEKGITSLLKRKAIAKLPDAAVPKPLVQDDDDGNQVANLGHTWNFDDEAIVEAPLEHLNIMVQDHVKHHELAPVMPFETRAEAIAFMTSDRDGGPLVLEDADDEPADSTKEG